MLTIEKRKTNMAEEKHLQKKFDTEGTDDMSAMRVLMHSVRGISAISAAPVLEFSEFEQ